jgi:hypothetical protein
MCTLRRCRPARHAVNDCGKNQFRNLLLLLQTHIRLSGGATFSGFHVYHHVYRVWCVILDQIVDLSRVVTEHAEPLCIGTSMSTGLILGPVEYHPTIFSLAANHPPPQGGYDCLCTPATLENMLYMVSRKSWSTNQVPLCLSSSSNGTACAFQKSAHGWRWPAWWYEPAKLLVTSTTPFDTSPNSTPITRLRGPPPPRL